MGPYANIVDEYRRQLSQSTDRFRTMTELLSIVDVSTIPDNEKLKRAWYIQLVASEILAGETPADNVWYG